MIDKSVRTYKEYFPNQRISVPTFKDHSCFFFRIYSSTCYVCICFCCFAITTKYWPFMPTQIRNFRNCRTSSRPWNAWIICQWTLSNHQLINQAELFIDKGRGSLRHIFHPRIRANNEKRLIFINLYVLFWIMSIKR